MSKAVQSQTWKDLQAHKETLVKSGVTMKNMFQSDPKRFDKFALFFLFHEITIVNYFLNLNLIDFLSVLRQKKDLFFLIIQKISSMKKQCLYY